MSYRFETDIARHIWESKYRYVEGDEVVDRDVEATWSRIARSLADVEEADRDGWETRFLEALRGFHFLPGGRIQAGAGTRRDVTLFNCFVMGRIEDSMDGIFESVKEGALTMQAGGGVGYDFSTLRPMGTHARHSGNIASGPVSFMRIWDATCATVLSMGARRGAMMATLRCDHPDIERFVDAKSDPRELRHFNCSVLATDAFMQAVEEDHDWPLVFPAAQLGEGDGDTVRRIWPGSDGPVACRVMKTVRARDLWHRIMRATYDYAEPGVVFIDRINAQNNLRYCEEICATNPCVTGDTWIHTDSGPRQVGDLIGRSFVARVDGRSYPSTPDGFFATGRKPIYRLITRSGYTVRLTADHPVLRISYPTRHRTTSEWVKTVDLEPGDQIALQNHRHRPDWPGPLNEQQGYLVGHLIGDGTFAGDNARLQTWPTTTDGTATDPAVASVMAYILQVASSLPHRADFSGWRRNRSSGYQFMMLASLTRLCSELDVVPGSKVITPAIERCSSDFYRGFLRGLFDADGSVQGSQSQDVSIRLAQSDIGVLQATQRMLLRLGIVSRLYTFRRSAETRLLPDGNGGRKAYQCQAQHELAIVGEGLETYASLVGFADDDKSKRLNGALARYRGALNRNRFSAVVDCVEPAGTEDVYDVQIPGRNAFDANGLHVHNCGEIPLPPYGACDLGSINLVPFVREPFGADARLDLDGIAELVPTAVRMLDNVIDASRYPLDAQREQALASRRIGLGFTGLADALAMLGLHYDSDAARAEAGRVMQTIRDAAYRTSVALAREKGAFPNFDADGFLEAPGPAGLPEDLRDAIAEHGIRNSHLTAIAPTGTISLLAENVSSGVEPAYELRYRRKVLNADGEWVEHVVEDFAHRLWRREHGSEDLPETLVTASKLRPMAHLEMQAAVQRYVDHAISKTINVPEDFPFEAFESVYREAYRMGLKGCTTFRPNPVTGAVLSGDEDGSSAAAESVPGDGQREERCTIERECD